MTLSMFLTRYRAVYADYRYAQREAIRLNDECNQLQGEVLKLRTYRRQDEQVLAVRADRISGLEQTVRDQAVECERLRLKLGAPVTLGDLMPVDPDGPGMCVYTDRGVR